MALKIHRRVMTRKSNSNQTEPGFDESQSFISHLLELRDRLLRMVLSVLVIFVALFYFRNDIYTLLSGPLTAHLPEGNSMIAIEVASTFLAPVKLTLVLSIFLAMPVILHQVWKFVAPGLYQHERKMAMPILATSIALFYAGAAFAYFVVFPLIFGFFTSTAPEGVSVMTDITKYLDFVLTVFFAFGIAFEVPIVTVVLVWAGATTPQRLGRMRPYIIVGAFVIGMMLTPPDIISQTLLAVPMWLLFEIGVVFSRFYVRDSEQTEGEEKSGEPATAAAGASSHTGEPAYTPMSDEEMEAELDRVDAEMSEMTGEGDEDDRPGGDDRDSRGEAPEDDKER